MSAEVVDARFAGVDRELIRQVGVIWHRVYIKCLQQCYMSAHARTDRISCLHAMALVE